MSTHSHPLAHAIKEGAARQASAQIRDASRALKGMASDLSYARAQRRGERLAKQMRREGSLQAKSPRKVIHLPK
ncbi:hypothetical protein [Pedococcus sp. 5OH_020]|uniref:hypothetical protein n=1 Tax=Pedococcus sp. 5OH_020 TaxID=2989814 RepID=UPI0022E9AEE6|nr:hypothetical protein [Pedococcus sp. 5OH_020]